MHGRPLAEHFITRFVKPAAGLAAVDGDDGVGSVVQREDRGVGVGGCDTVVAHKRQSIHGHDRAPNVWQRLIARMRHHPAVRTAAQEDRVLRSGRFHFSRARDRGWDLCAARRGAYQIDAKLSLDGFEHRLDETHVVVACRPAAVCAGAIALASGGG